MQLHEICATEKHHKRIPKAYAPNQLCTVTNSCIHAKSKSVESVISTEENRRCLGGKCNTVQQGKNSEGKMNLKI